MGYADNFLHVLERVTTPLVAFCDQDDVWLPGKLERCAAAFANPAVQLAIHNAQVTDADLKVQGPLYGFKRDVHAGPLSLDPFLNPLGFTMVFRRDVVARFDWRQRPRNYMGEPASRLNHDQWTYFLLHALGRVTLMAEPLALYRQHGGNTFGVRAGERATLENSRATDIGAYEQRRDSCLAYAEFWRGHSTRDPMRAEATAAAAYYARLAQLLDARVRLNVASNPWRRCATLLSTAARGGYRARGRGGLGARAFVKDSLRVVRRAEGGR
jgi:hypothetical protein